MNLFDIFENKDMCKVCGQTPCNCTSIDEGVAEASFDYTTKDLGNDYAGFASNHSMKHKFLAKIKPEKQQLYKDKMNNMHDWDSLFQLFKVATARGDIIEQGVAEAGYPEVDHMPGKCGIGLDSTKPKDTYVATFHASKEKEAQEFAKKHGHIVKKHVYPKSANNSQPHEFQVHKNEQGVAEGFDIGQEWMSDTELDQYVPKRLQQQWRELLGYDENGNPSALWANLTGGYEPDVNDPQHRRLMVKVANKWFAAKKIPNVKFFDVKDADDELEWLVQIGQQGVAEGYDRSNPFNVADFKRHMDSVTGSIMGRAPTNKYQVGQTVKYQMEPAQAGGSGVGKITRVSKSGNHYEIDGSKIVNHYEIKGVEQGVAEETSNAPTKYRATVEYGPTAADAHFVTVTASSTEEAEAKVQKWCEKKGVRNPMITINGADKPVDVAEGDVVAFPKKHKGDLASVNDCPKCGGDLQGGKYMGHEVKVCMPCKQVYLPPNSGIDQKGNKIDEGSQFERKITRTQALIQDYYNRARASSNDIKRDHYIDMARQLEYELEGMINDANQAEQDSYEIAQHDATPSATWNRGGLEEQGVAEGAPIVVMPRADRLKKPEPTKVRYQGDIVPPTKPPSTEKRGVKGRPGQRPMPEQGVAEGQLNEYLVQAGMPVKDVLALNLFQDTGPDGQEGMADDPRWSRLMKRYQPIANMLAKKIMALGKNRRLSDAEADAIEQTWYDGSDAYDDMEVEYLADCYNQQIDIIEALLAGNITDEECGEGVAEGLKDTIYPNAEVIKSKNGKPLGEIYQDGSGWGCFHYKADNGADSIESREQALEWLKDLHDEYRQDQRLREDREDTLKNYIRTSAGDAINRQNIANRTGTLDPRIAKRNAGQLSAQNKLSALQAAMSGPRGSKAAPTADKHPAQVLDEAISSLEMAELLYAELDKRFPDLVKRYGHEVVGDAIMDVAEANDDQAMEESDVARLVDDVIAKLEQYVGDREIEEPEVVDEFIDPEMEKEMNYASRHYAGYDKEQAFKKLLQRGIKHSKDTDREHDAELAQLAQDVAALKQKVGISETRMYYNIVGTSDNELRTKFGMRKDPNGWFIAEGASKKTILEAFRAFGDPKAII